VERAGASDALDRALGRTKGLYLPAALVSELESPSERWHRLRKLIDDEHVARWRQQCLAKLRSASPEERLRNHPRLGFLLGRWREWAAPADTTPPTLQEVAAVIAASPSGALNLVRAFSSRRVSSGGPDDPGRVTHGVEFEELVKLVDLDTLEASLVTLGQAGLGPEERSLLDGFWTGLRNRRRDLSATP
jgi:hypothetical protein